MGSRHRLVVLIVVLRRGLAREAASGGRGEVQGSHFSAPKRTQPQEQAGEIIKSSMALRNASNMFISSFICTLSF